MPAHRRTLRRYEGLNHARYLTCSCYRRLPLFRNDAIKDAFVQHLATVREQMQFELFAWVIMPEHFHLLLRPRYELNTTRPGVPHVIPKGNVCDSQTVTQILHSLKRPFSRQVLSRWRELDAPILEQIADRHGRPHFWQTGGGYDRNIFSEEELHEKINYIHANPVRRGLVQHASDYRWSSALFDEDSARYNGPTITRWA